MNNPQDSFPHQIFRAYDIRGKVELLTPQLIHNIAYALAQQMKEKGQTQIVIGYDARLTSPSYAKIIEHVFIEQNFKVTALGCCATPQMYFAARQFDGNGIMITASHNPKTDNGIKWIIQNEPPTPEMIQDIGYQAEKFYQRNIPLEISGEEKPQIKLEFCLQYQQAILSDIQLKRPL